MSRATADLRIGWVGPGAMGLPMARSLIARGFPLTVLRHRDLRAPAALAADGARIVQTPRALAADADAVFLMLPSSREVEDVVLGPAGLAAGLQPGQVVVDMGTSDPASSRRIAGLLAGRGVHFLDAPVTGGVKGAAAGTLVIMVGGPTEALDLVRPALEALGGTVVHVGEVGTGHALKLINNLIALSTSALVAEALRLARAAGLPLPAVLDVLRRGSADSAILRGIAARLASQRFEPGFTVALAAKDLSLAGALAAAAGVAVPLAGAARQAFDAADEAGLAGMDTSALAARSLSLV